MRVLLGIVIGCAIGAGGAIAAAPKQWLHQGIYCRTFVAVGSPVACVKDDGTGYGVGISRTLVVVTRQDGRIVFSRRQP